jgi:hypothetical protein
LSQRTCCGPQPRSETSRSSTTTVASASALTEFSRSGRGWGVSPSAPAADQRSLGGQSQAHAAAVARGSTKRIGGSARASPVQFARALASCNARASRNLVPVGREPDKGAEAPAEKYHSVTRRGSVT